MQPTDLDPQFVERPRILEVGDPGHAQPGRCVVEAATFAGETTVLVKSPVGADVHYIALSVLDGFEESMAQSFLEARPEGGEALGVYPSKEAALTYAKTLCPE